MTNAPGQTAEGDSQQGGPMMPPSQRKSWHERMTAGRPKRQVRVKGKRKRGA